MTQPVAPDPGVRLVHLPPSCLRALLEGDLAGAGEVVGLELPAAYLDEGWLWRLRLEQLAADPRAHGWLVHAVATHQDVVVGHAGFHGPPDDQGMVEVSYTIVPDHRGRGHARSALAGLLQRAAASAAVRTVRASVSPDNAASLHLVRTAGFVQVGEQWDDQDGLELVFERPSAARPGPSAAGRHDPRSGGSGSGAA